MASVLRSTSVTLALSYVALGIVALILFAAPLWYAWQVTIRETRIEILSADAQRLADVYRRDGADAIKTFIDQRIGMQIVGERFLLLADGNLQRVAGNLDALAGRPAAEARRLQHAARPAGPRCPDGTRARHRAR